MRTSLKIMGALIVCTLTAFSSAYVRAESPANAESREDAEPTTVTLLGTVTDSTTRKPVTKFSVKTEPDMPVALDLQKGTFEIENVPRDFLRRSYDTQHLDPSQVTNLFVTISSLDYNPLRTQVDGYPEDGVIEHSFKLLQDSTFTGVVADKETSEPLKNIAVQLVPNDHMEIPEEYLPKDQAEALAAYRAMKGEQDAKILKTTTDENGRFTFPDIAMEWGTLLIKDLPDHAGFRQQVFMRNGETVDVGTIRMSRGAGLKGQILRMADKSPVEGVQLRLVNFAGNSPQPLLSTTDKQGRFEFKNVPAGPYFLADAKTRALFGEYLEIQDSQTLNKTYHIGSTTLKGKIFINGKLVSSAVRLQPASDQAAVGIMESSEGFEAHNLSPGNYTLTVAHRAVSADQEITIPNEPVVTQDFHFRAPRVTLTVKDKAGKPVPNEHVSIMYVNSNSVYSQTTDDNGQTVFDLMPAEYSVRVYGHDTEDEQNRIKVTNEKDQTFDIIVTPSEAQEP